MAGLIPETVSKLFTPETLRSAAKQSEGIHLVSLRLRRAIKKFLRDREDSHMNRKVLSLSESFNGIKDVNLQLCSSTSRELVEDPLKSMESSKRWKIKSSYGDIGFKYRDDETLAYVAARMPAVYSACHRVLREVRRRLPDFSPARVLDFGSGTGSALWALREVWPQSLESVNLIEPSKAMQRACQSLLQDLKDLPLIHSYDSIQALTQKLLKPDRVHDLVIASYVLGEIPSLKDRITIVRQLWDLTRDVLVLVEPGTPQGSSIICQMRSHILWMEKRKCRKSDNAASEASMDTRNTPANTAAVKSGAFVVAPCAHDGACPLENSGKYCHFVQRLERTSSQRAYKRSKGEPLRGFEDEKFCFVALRRGERPREAWPLDGMKFDTLKEQHAKRNPEDLIIDFEDQFGSEFEDAPYEEEDLSPTTYASDFTETDTMNENEELDEKEAAHADLGSGWGRIIFSPVRRGKQVSMDVCRSTKRDGSEGSFHRVVITQSKNPTLHLQARRSLWGDLWPF
ncbi:copper ion binding / methyltransferase isoform X5 [Tasmannia lanceolata]|uniref:copper ion binding / methyltransferase isoform X5 n=1 Tax=Tasmannia lanceolata TaxID=3420 RepID=UPI00406320E6